MKIVIAIDSFKGSASSIELAKYIKNGILEVYRDSDIVVCPIADGGEGTADALLSSEEARLCRVTCKDPLGNNIKVKYAILKNNTAVIEMSSASGLTLIPSEKRDPSIATSYGTGDLIKDAISKGVREFIIGLGGSATNDAGLGMLRSLGFRFLDEFGSEICYAKDMKKIVSIDKTDTLKELKKCRFTVACDVNNPLHGKNGATYMYAKQKGASQKMILDLDEQLKYFAKISLKNTIYKYDEHPGSGAAGGLGFAFLAFLNAKLKSGIEIILEQIEFKEKIKGADFVITGEGKIDKQSIMGKVVNGIGLLCKEEGVTCIALSGDISEAQSDMNSIGINAYFSILDAPMSLKEAMNKENTLRLVQRKTEQIFRLIQTKFD